MTWQIAETSIVTKEGSGIMCTHTEPYTFMSGFMSILTTQLLVNVKQLS